MCDRLLGVRGSIWLLVRCSLDGCGCTEWLLAPSIVLTSSVRNCKIFSHFEEGQTLETGIWCAGGEAEGIHAEAHEHNRRRGEMVPCSWNPHECLPGRLLLHEPAPPQRLHSVTSFPAVKCYPIDSLAVALKFKIGMGAIIQERALHEHTCTAFMYTMLSWARLVDHLSPPHAADQCGAGYQRTV